MFPHVHCLEFINLKFHPEFLPGHLSTVKLFCDETCFIEPSLVICNSAKHCHFTIHITYMNIQMRKLRDVILFIMKTLIFK